MSGRNTFEYALAHEINELEDKSCDSSETTMDVSRVQVVMFGPVLLGGISSVLVGKNWEMIECYKHRAALLIYSLISCSVYHLASSASSPLS